MIRVRKTNTQTGESIELAVNEKTWKRIVSQPTVFGPFLKWEKVPGKDDPVFDAGADPNKGVDPKELELAQLKARINELEKTDVKIEEDKKVEEKKIDVNDDLGEPKTDTYTEEAYEHDYEKGKALVKEKKGKEALPYLERALEFKPKNVYIRKLLKEING